MSSRKVSFARFHASIFIPGPGLGELGDQLPPKAKTIPGLAMTWEDGALYVSAPGVSLVIPSANVKFAQFAEASPEAPKADKKH